MAGQAQTARVQQTQAAKGVHILHVAATDPVATGLAAQTQVSVTPTQTTFLSINGEQYIFFAGQTETVAQSVKDQLVRAGKA